MHDLLPLGLGHVHEARLSAHEPGMCNMSLNTGRLAEHSRQALPAHPTQHWFSVFSRREAGTPVARMSGLTLTKMHDSMQSPCALSS